MKLGYGDSRQGRQESEEFDTVLLAIGRTGEAHKLGLADAGASRLQHPDVWSRFELHHAIRCYPFLLIRFIVQRSLEQATKQLNDCKISASGVVQSKEWKSTGTSRVDKRPLGSIKLPR